MNYTVTQYSKWTTGIILIVMLFFYLGFYYGIGDNPIGEEHMMLMEAILLIVLALFYSMTIELEERTIRIKFGIGLIQRTIKLETIEAVSSVRNKWWYGFGIRLTPHGWMWNIEGLNAVEIKYKGTGTHFRIGVEDSQKLKNEMDKRISRLENRTL